MSFHPYDTAAPAQGFRDRWLTIAAVSITLAATPLGTTAASESKSGLEGLGAPMTDEALGDIRGKFVGAGGVAYFTVELRSSWTNAQGVTVAGVLAMSLDMRNASGDARSSAPLVLVGWSRGCDSCGAGETAATAAGAPAFAPSGLGSVHGVVQSQEIRGSDNVVQNGLRINVVSADQASGALPAGLTPTTSSSTHGLPDGGAVHFTVSSSQLGLSLQNGDQAGLVGQAVNSGQNQISQNVFLTSDMNTVQNSVGLTIGVDHMRQAEQVNLQHSMSVLQGLGY